ncbi:MAG: ferritin-like domain-containing protein, partial [Polyangiaceae bacterium]
MSRLPCSLSASSGGGRPALPARTAAEALARAASLDQASVQVFLELAWDLEGLSAPPSLVRRAIQAAADEVRHAKAMTALARGRGVVVSSERPPPAKRQDLFAVALGNARDGCVRATWQAACALAQSNAAADVDVREAMVVVARDEVRHARLALDIADWAGPLLTGEQRDRVWAEQARTLDGLED